MAAYLLDTTVLLQQFQNKSFVRNWFGEVLERRDTLATTVVNVAEVFVRAHPIEQPYWEELFRWLPVLPVLPPDGEWAGKTQYRLARDGFTIHLPDALVAAVAASNGLTLVTANAKDFERMGIEFLHLDGA